MEIIKHLKASISKSLETLASKKESLLVSQLNIELTLPEKKYGDYATNIAFSCASILKKNPFEIAKILSTKIKSPFIETITPLAPGFINLTLNNTFKTTFLKEMGNKDVLEKINFHQGKKVLLEYISANPTGPLHIGHGRWAAIGHTLANILSWTGCKVTREFYVNNTGKQIEALRKSVQCLKADKAAPPEGYRGNYLKALMDQDGDPIQLLLEDQQKTLKALGVGFDHYFKESTLHQTSAPQNVIDLLKEKGQTYHKDGALWLKLTDKGDHKDRVLKKADHTLTYFAVDIAYHYEKVKRNYDLLINIFGADHHGYIPRIKAAVKILSKNKTPFEIIIGQLVHLFKDGKPIKMSKRTGDLITLQEVIDEIGKEATLYYLTMRMASSPVEFDLQVAKEKNINNPLYYIQYAHARICSVFKKASSQNLAPISKESFDYHYIKDPLIDSLLLLMIQFEQEVIAISKSYEVHHLNRFLTKMASDFHKIYNKLTFVSIKEKEKTKQYLFFLKRLKMILKTGLNFMGIKAKETM